MTRYGLCGDRRRNRRVDLGGTALVLQNGDRVGWFVVQNLSAGGVLLTGAHEVPRRDQPVDVVLTLPGRTPRTLEGAVSRVAAVDGVVALAVSFRDVEPDLEDEIQDALVEALAHEPGVPKVGNPQPG